MQGLKLQGGGTCKSALALRPGTRVVWECATLATASPALLSTLPVVHVHTSVQDPIAVIQVCGEVWICE